MHKHRMGQEDPILFEALNHELHNSHLDLSFNETGKWPRVGPDQHMPPSLWISLGDPVAGPAVQLIVTPPVPENMWLDTHYHGSDQFRAQLQGGMQLQRMDMKAPAFGYQKAGVPYREGALGGLTEDSWMFAVHGDRRGARGTRTREDGTFMLPDVGDDQLDRFVDSPNDPYWCDVPGGAKGISAISTSLGPVRGGFAWGSFLDSASWVEIAEGTRMTAGLFGHGEVGPAIFTLNMTPEAQFSEIPALPTEIAIAVVDGDCFIAGDPYAFGDVRIQSQSIPLEHVRVGEGGANLLLLVADRRAFFSTGQGAPLWDGLRREADRLRSAFGHAEHQA